MHVRIDETWPDQRSRDVTSLSTGWYRARRPRPGTDNASIAKEDDGVADGRGAGVDQGASDESDRCRRAVSGPVRRH